MVRVFILWLDGKIGRDSSLDCLWKLDLWIVVHETVGPAVCRTLFIASCVEYDCLGSLD